MIKQAFALLKNIGIITTIEEGKSEMAANTAVKLFGYWGSPYCNRIEIALKLKGVPYEYFEEDLYNKSPQVLKYNPVHQKVPVLVHNGKPVAESAVILEYIEDTWKNNPMLPEDPHDRARARFWVRFIDDKCFPPMWKACLTKGSVQQMCKEESSEMLQYLEDELKDKKFFGGDRIGMVDVMANFVAIWFRTFQDEARMDLLTKDKFPRLWEWSELFVNTSPVNQCLPPKEKLVRRFRSLISPFRGF